MEYTDVVVIGAGPAGAVAAALLVQKGYAVTVLEKGHFPRFVIGESLLPACMPVLAKAGMAALIHDRAEALAFQPKNGAVFVRRGKQTTFDFREKFTQGPGTTYQVRRADFDALLISQAQAQGAEVRFGHAVTGFSDTPAGARVDIACQQQRYSIEARFVLDASGYGRVLPRLLSLERSSELPARGAYFTHIADGIRDDEEYDREKILIAGVGKAQDMWLWLIPFADGQASLGIVGKQEQLQALGNNPLSVLQAGVADVALLQRLLARAKWDTGVGVRTLTNYSADVSTLYGEHFALLGNASTFLDPVFSSGVTIAVVSAELATTVLDRQLSGEAVNWQKDYAEVLNIGIEAFKTYVLGWYDGSFQEVIYHNDRENNDIRRMICAILAGYAWDSNNPYVAKPRRRLKALSELIREGK